MILRIENWFIPLIEATNLLITQKLSIIFCVIIENKIIKGIIFWIVDKMKQLYQFNPSITDGTHNWNGKNPIFMKIEIINKILKNSLFILKLSIFKKDTSMIIDEILWIRKYNINLVSFL